MLPPFWIFLYCNLKNPLFSGQHSQRGYAISSWCIDFNAKIFVCTECQGNEYNYSGNFTEKRLVGQLFERGETLSIWMLRVQDQSCNSARCQESLWMHYVIGHMIHPWPQSWYKTHEMATHGWLTALNTRQIKHQQPNCKGHLYSKSFKVRIKGWTKTISAVLKFKTNHRSYKSFTRAGMSSPDSLQNKLVHLVRKRWWIKPEGSSLPKKTSRLTTRTSSDSHRQLPPLTDNELCHFTVTG